MTFDNSKRLSSHIQIQLRPYDILLDYREAVPCLDVSQAYVWSLQYLHLAIGSPFVSLGEVYKMIPNTRLRGISVLRRISVLGSVLDLLGRWVLPF
ncbi:uncharacterized protein G2W53_039793 [Senna tora]|uniref:Uncharacterized protein n=1 Tax=Senna tora TaxID=362788 RepID=A0A834STX6_9FABA|nr:uncharacterized protein G2W53_039793 [Senna tora]